MSHYLTIDLGTTLFKFAIFDDRGKLLALARVKPSIEHPRPTWWEMNVASFRETIIEGCRQLREKISFERLVAISYASQANSFVLLAPNDDPLCPLILWPDERAIDYADEISKAAQAPTFRAETGIPSLGHQFAVAKLLRFQKENSTLRQSAARFFFISDLLTYLFTRKHVTEGGIAGLSGASDIRTLSWRTHALPELGMDSLKLPEIARAGTDLGPVDASLARELELPTSCRFVLGCLDQYAGAIGTGTVSPGRLTETTGTVLAAVHLTRQLRADAPNEVFAGPSFDPGLFFEMSFSSTSANLLEHYRNSLPDSPSFEALNQLAADASPSDLMIESLAEGRPIDASFRHVTPAHSRGQVVRAIMECVARQLRSQVLSLCPSRLPDSIASAGGGAKSSLWLQLKSDIVGCPCRASGCEEPTSLGAAVLAMHGVSGNPVHEIASNFAAQ
jgi:xylulokinase